MIIEETTASDEPRRADEAAEEQPPTAEAPPPIGTWRTMYAIVLGELVLLIVLFYLFARAWDGTLAP